MLCVNKKEYRLGQPSHVLQSIASVKKVAKKQPPYGVVENKSLGKFFQNPMKAYQREFKAELYFLASGKGGPLLLVVVIIPSPTFSSTFFEFSILT